MQKNTILSIGSLLVLLLQACSSGIESLSDGSGAPAWWYNPRRDDAELIFVKGSSANCANEHDARAAAIDNARAILARRAGLDDAFLADGRQKRRELAFRKIDIHAEHSVKKGSRWYAWVLLSYPQSEYAELLDRIASGQRNIDEIKRLSGGVPRDFEISIGTVDGRDSYQSGEKIQFVVQAPETCYIAIFCHQSDGSSVLLYPNRWARDCRIPGGETRLLVPDGRDGFEITAAAPFGTDLVQVIACTRKSALHERIGREIGDIGSSPFAVMTRGLYAQELKTSLADNEEGAVRWCENSISISTFP